MGIETMPVFVPLETLNNVTLIVCAFCTPVQLTVTTLPVAVAEAALPPHVAVISKGTQPDRDAYSGFEGTDLASRLREAAVQRVFVGGLATDYCVFNTVKDARKAGFATVLLLDAVRAVDVEPDDGEAAIAEMLKVGAQPGRLEWIHS